MSTCNLSAFDDDVDYPGERLECGCAVHRTECGCLQFKYVMIRNYQCEEHGYEITPEMIEKGEEFARRALAEQEELDS